MKNWQARLKALNEAMGGKEPEDIYEMSQSPFAPFELAGSVGSGLDSITGAPTRAAVGAAITDQDPFQAFERQFGANPELAPSFGMVEDALLDPTNLVAASPKMAARMAALGEVGAVGNLDFPKELETLRAMVREHMSKPFDSRSGLLQQAINRQRNVVAEAAKQAGDTSGWADIGINVFGDRTIHQIRKKR